jgi:hypothetical protein
MNSTKKTARLAGAFYVLTSAIGVLGIIYVPNKLFDYGNAAATATNILGSEMLFRVGIVSELLSAAGFVFVVWALYRLFGGVNKSLASLMAMLILTSIPIMFVSVLCEIAALTVLHGANSMTIFGAAQRNALALLFLQIHGQGYGIAEIFWGLWLVPFGLLVIRSGFLPRILGVLLIIACFGYLADSLTSLLLPSFEDVVGRFTGFLTACELPTMFWLLIMGAKDQPLNEPA